MSNGTMTLPTWGWPDFQEGRVLTHNDLNRLRDYLYSKYTFQNRSLLGFGVACGLDGTVSGTRLTISPGFALTGDGRELRLDAEAGFELEDLAGSDLAEFDFVDADEDGYTAVLCADDTPRAAGGECDPDDCTLHTDVVDEGARVVFARGRLRTEGLFGHEVFDLEPLAIDKVATITGFKGLRDGLTKHLTPELAEPTVKLIAGLELTGPLGVDLMKVGILNEVLYAAWEYFRCRAYGTFDCFGEDRPDCVALGWISENGAWSWDCGHRHHFELSRALYAAVRGERCQDLCQAHLDHVRAILETFQPPPTQEEDPPKDWDPDVDVDLCDTRSWLKHRCTWWPKDFPYEVELPPIRTKGKFPIDPLWDPPKSRDFVRPEELLVDLGFTTPMPEDVVVNLRNDPAGVGLMGTSQFVGFDGHQVEAAIESTLAGRGLRGTVDVVSMDDFGQTEGMRPGLVVAASDGIVLGVNGKGTVLAVGAVPTSETLQQVPGIRADATTAMDLATGLDGRFTTLQGSFQQLNQEFLALDPERLGQLPGDVDERFESLEATLPSREVLDKASAFVTTFEKLQADVDDIENALGQAEKAIAQHGTTLENLKSQAASFTRTQEEVAGALARVDALKETTGTLEGRIERSATEHTRRTDEVVGRLITRPSGEGFRPEVAVTESMVASLESMRRAIAAAATQERAEGVRAALDQGAAALEVLRGQAEADVPSPEGERVAEVMESMLAAVRAAGLNTRSSEYRRARTDVTRAREFLRAPRE